MKIRECLPSPLDSDQSYLAIRPDRLPLFGEMRFQP
jgi:hypothetical protein